MEKNKKIKEINITNSVIGLIFLALAVFLAVAFYWPGNRAGAMGNFCFKFSTGLVGPLTYVLPLFFVYFALEQFLEKRRILSKLRLIHSITLAFLIAGLIHLLSFNQDSLLSVCKDQSNNLVATKFLSVLWAQSINSDVLPSMNSAIPGGILVGLPATGIYVLAGKVGSLIIYGFATFVEVVWIFNISIANIVVKAKAGAIKTGSSLLQASKEAVQYSFDDDGASIGEPKESNLGKNFGIGEINDEMNGGDFPAYGEAGVDFPAHADKALDSDFVGDKFVPSEIEGERLKISLDSFVDQHSSENSALPIDNFPLFTHSEKKNYDNRYESPAIDSIDSINYIDSIDSIDSEFVKRGNSAVPEDLPLEVIHPVEIKTIISESEQWLNDENDEFGQNDDKTARQEEPEWQEGEELFPPPIRISPDFDNHLGQREDSSNPDIEQGFALSSSEFASDSTAFSDPNFSRTGGSTSGHAEMPGSISEIMSNAKAVRGTVLPGASASVSAVASASAMHHNNGTSTKEGFKVQDGDERDRQVKADIRRRQLRLEYQFPPLELLSPQPTSTTSTNNEYVQELAKRLETTLTSFGVQATVTNVTYGPTITRFELSPAPGVKVSKVVSLSDDIALSLAAVSVRIEAPIPGKSAIGIEIPNKKTQMVGLRELLADKSFRTAKSKLTVVLGRDIPGQPVLCNLRTMPHLLIAGATGSGKSVCINCILMSILYNAHPDDVKLLMIDPKVVELKVYNGIPHLLAPVVTDPKKAANTLNWAVAEMERRYRMFAEYGARDYDSYQIIAKEQELERIPLILFVIDELADLMTTCPNEVEDAISRLTAMARAAGIHLIIATQRPSVDVITGVIKSNIPSRIAFAVSSQIDSRTILDSGGAEKLLGKGDMLYNPQGSYKPIRAQGAFIADKEVEKVISFLKAQNYSLYDEKIAETIVNTTVESPKNGGKSEENYDELFPQAVEILIDAGYASISILQRKMSIGYQRAARIIDSLEELGYVGPSEGSKARKIRLTRSEWEAIKAGDDNGQDY